MNPIVFYILRWEKELEIQRFARTSGRQTAEPPPRTSATPQISTDSASTPPPACVRVPASGPRRVRCRCERR